MQKKITTGVSHVCIVCACVQNVWCASYKQFSALQQVQCRYIQSLCSTTVLPTQHSFCGFGQDLR